jgi:hypothetical protein
MTPMGPERRDLVVARVALGAAAVGVVWLVWRSPAARAAARRGAKFAFVTWLPAYVASQVREAWAASAPAPAAAPSPLPVSADETPAGSASPGHGVAAFIPPAPSE